MNTSVLRQGQLLFVATLALFGCSGSNADLEFCPAERTRVAFEPAILEAGHYEIEVLADSQRTRCEADLAADGALGGNPVCAGAVELDAGRRTSSAADGSGVSAPYGLTGLAWDGLSTEVTVTVRKDGAPWKSGRTSLQEAPSCDGGALRRGTVALQ